MASADVDWEVVWATLTLVDWESAEAWAPGARRRRRVVRTGERRGVTGWTTSAAIRTRRGTRIMLTAAACAYAVLASHYCTELLCFELGRLQTAVKLKHAIGTLFRTD